MPPAVVLEAGVRTDILTLECLATLTVILFGVVAFGLPIINLIRFKSGTISVPGTVGYYRVTLNRQSQPIFYWMTFIACLALPISWATELVPQYFRLMSAYVHPALPH